jgi:hypothetical protein
MLNSGDCINEAAARLSLARQCFELAAYEPELDHLQQAKRWLEEALRLASGELRRNAAPTSCLEGPDHYLPGQVVVAEDDGYPD